MSNQLKYKLLNINNKDLKTIQKEVSLGAKFIFFNYRIGLGAISLLKQSPIIYINKLDEELLNYYKKKYNKLNLIFGPWTLFRGPILTYNTYKINKLGGIDVTNDIMVNLDQFALTKNEVEIKFIHNIFTKVNSTEKKNITKVIHNLDLNIIPLKKVYLGLLINVDEYTEPLITIGFELFNRDMLDEKYVFKKLYKSFYKHVEFYLINLETDVDFSNKLIEQGELIYSK